MRSRSSGASWSGRLEAFETVVRETPSLSAMVFSVTRFATPPFYFIGRTGAAGRADVANVEAKWRTSIAAMGINMTRSLLYRFRLNRYSDGSRPICQGAGD